MNMWLERMGLSPNDLDKLNSIHVAGTKGKSSTCAFVDSILNHFSLSSGVPKMVACYTSPHVESPLERLRFRGRPISEELFTKYVFEVLDKLEAYDPKPVYFRFLTLVFFWACLKEGVDAAVVEVGVGGEYDSTNVMPRPRVTAITTLDLDHTTLLGDNLKDIAWHKGGIMKTDVQAYSVPQVLDATAMLRQRAEEKGASLEFVCINSELYDFKIQPPEAFQQLNASIAVRIAQKYLELRGLPISEITTAAMREPLEATHCPGKLETIQRDKIQWNLDGAHTKESLTITARWIGGLSHQISATRVLVFNHQSQRNAIELLTHLFEALRNNNVRFEYVLFTTNVTNSDGTYEPEFANHNADKEAIAQQTAQREYARTWVELDPSAITKVHPTIEDTFADLRHISDDQGPLQIFVTGSNHLVGGMRYIINKKQNQNIGEAELKAAEGLLEGRNGQNGSVERRRE